MDEQKVVVLTKSKDTPGTIVYSTNEPGKATRAVYVNKGTWETMPDQIKLTLEPVRK